MAVKQKPGEDFSTEKVNQAEIMLGNGETKKSVCDFLGMNYSTTRLAKVIQENIDKIIRDEKIKKAFRKKPLELQDIKYICQEYLNGEPLSGISENTYRSTTVIKNVLERYNIPLRDASNNYFNPVFIDEDIPIDFKPGDLVFSARYNSLSEIIKKMDDNVYRICVLGKNQQYAYQPIYELADLRKVQKELDISGIWETDTRQRAWASVLEGRKKKKKG